MPKPPVEQRTRRAEDGGWLCRVARIASMGWEFIDRRQIDKHLVSLGILYGTVQVTKWAMYYAETYSDKSGIEVAAVMAAIGAPYMALQAAAISFYFRSRTTP